ncbi:MAG TPA: hypothetical protein P5079_03695 [Elusimicrobiota bacterium]|nr:hypothetical protein [Elusimicrobiota bacterium]
MLIQLMMRQMMEKSKKLASRSGGGGPSGPGPSMSPALRWGLIVLAVLVAGFLFAVALRLI